MTGEIPFWKGKDVKLLITFLNDKLVLDHFDLDVGIEGDEIEEDVCGEDRARLDWVTSHYTLVINSKQQKIELFTAFIKAQKQRDARTIPANSAIGILIYMNDATQAAFQCREYILGKWKGGYGGRKERNKMSVPGRFRYFDALPTVGG